MADIALEPVDTGSPIEHASEVPLSDRLTALRRRTRFVVTDRTLLTIGSILMPLGAILVLLGWYGAAHTTRLFEEVPYLISGGLLGIVLSTIGAALYFGYWLTRLVAGERQIVEVLARMEAKLDAAGLDAGASVADVPGRLVATPTGTMFHRPDCPVVADRPAGELRTITLPATGMSPCKLCAPLG